MKTKVISVAFFAAILGLFFELLALPSFTSLVTISKKLVYLKYWLSSVDLSFLGSNLFINYNFDNDLVCNYLNLIFYSTLLVGAIAYVKSDQKETRLIRFCFSIIFLNNILFITGGIIASFLYSEYISRTDYYWLYKALNICINVFWIYFSFLIIKQLNADKAIERNGTVKEEDEVSAQGYVLSSIGQRFFHVVADTFFCLFIFSGFIGLLSFMSKYLEAFGNRGVLYFCLLIFRLIYYPFFEYILGATPAKFLTESRVVYNSGEKIGLKTAFIRTVSRFVPFEPLSFFSSRNWHDSWTDTIVVKESKTGVNGNRYFLIFPLFILLGLTGYFGHEKYKDHLNYLHEKNKYEKNILTIENRLQKISDRDIIKIEDLAGYGSVLSYLKVEKINKDAIVFSLVKVANDYDFALIRVEKYYEANKKDLETIEIKKSDLMQAYTKNYDDYRADKKQGMDLLKDGKKYEIEYIEQLYEPIIKDAGTGSIRGNSICLEIINEGWNANVVEIKNIEGSLEWDKSVLPEMKTRENYTSSSNSLCARNYKREEKYKFIFTIVDSLNRKQSYIIEGEGLKREMTKVE